MNLRLGLVVAGMGVSIAFGVTNPALESKTTVTFYTHPAGADVQVKRLDATWESIGSADAQVPVPDHILWPLRDKQNPAEYITMRFSAPHHVLQDINVGRDLVNRVPHRWPQSGVIDLPPADLVGEIDDALADHPWLRVATVGAALAGVVLVSLAARRYGQARASLRRARLLEEQMQDRPPSQDSRIGTVTGRYLVQAQLGAGGMAVVYEGVPFDTLNRDDAVAIKVIIPSAENSQVFRDRFEREIRIYQSLSHPNIVRLIDWGNDATFYIVMELIRGTTLKARLAAPPYPLEEVLTYMRPIASALHYAHAAGVVHRDLKPENVMVSDMGLVKVMDFGLARDNQVDKRITNTGTALGTPAYMAPEQIMGQLDAASDQYAFGIMLYELLAGHHPLWEEGDLDGMPLLLAHLNNDPKPLSAFRPDLPVHVSNAIMRMLAKDPQDRFDGVLSALHALETV